MVPHDVLAALLRPYHDATMPQRHAAAMWHP